MTNPFETSLQSDKTETPSDQQIIELISRLAGREEALGLKTIELSAGEVLFNQGEPGDCMFLVLSGKLDVRVSQPDGSEHLINVLSEGSIVGEMALLSGQTRMATVRVREDIRLIRITEKDIGRLVQGDIDLIDNISTVAKERWENLHLENSLKKLFGNLPKEIWRELQEQLEWYYLSNGDILFKEGDASDGMYLVVSGRLRAMVRTTDGNEQPLGEIGPSEMVGEYALLTNEPRSATVYAVRESSLARMSPALFDQCVRKYPEMMRNIARIMATRSKRMIQPITSESPERMTFALIQAGPTVDIRAFAEKLSATLATYGASLVVGSEDFDESFGRANTAHSSKDAPIQPVIVAKLNEFEEAHRYLLFLTEDIHSPWTQRAIGQADRVLIVADSTGDPEPSKVERMLEEQAVPVRADLILLQPADAKAPTGTDAWLDARNVHAYYHVRQGDRAHMERLARRLTGHAVGLVFSGGAARGYAEMGAIKAILELEIPVDYVAGTSMGAIMASAIACGFSYEKCEEQAQWCANLGVMDHTLPFAALTASDHVTRICRQAYGSRFIEDLWIPFFCVSTNLSSAEKKIHQRGLLWRAVRSSMSIPGVFLPVLEDGDILVDGGIIDNYPVELMSKLVESNRIIGININPHRERKFEFDYDTSLSGWRILMNRLNPFTKKLRVPSITNIIMRSLDINSKRSSIAQESLADLTICPDTRGFALKDYDKWHDIAQRGFDDAFEPLQKWKKRQPDL